MTAAELFELPDVRTLFPALLPHVSVEEYERMGDLGILDQRTELIRGVIIKKMPKSPLHASIATTLHQIIFPVAVPGTLVRQEQPLKFADSEPEPDIAVVRGERREFLSEHPRRADFVIEVAVTTLALDRANAALYAENGVAEYWIIIANQQAIEVYRRPEGGTYQEKSVHGADEEVTCGVFPKIRIKAAALL